MVEIPNIILSKYFFKSMRNQKANEDEKQILDLYILEKKDYFNIKLSNYHHIYKFKHNYWKKLKILLKNHF